MWIVTVRSPRGEPREYVLKPGKTTIGRKSDSDIPLPDESASRNHSELHLDPSDQSIVLVDVGSTNGTFVNRERVTQPRRVTSEDQVRIGQHVLTLTRRDTEPGPGNEVISLPGTQPLTRDLLLESLDHHAVLLYEVASRLNTVIDLDTALREVSDMMRVAMGADKCQVILAERFSQLHDLGFPVSIARLALDQRSAVIIPDAQANPQLGKSAVLMRIRSAMCVPVMSGEKVVALIYVYKTRPLARPFDQSDLQLAVAISHQAALTIQRTRLLEHVRKEQRIRQLLQRFLSPPEAEYLLQDYLQTGALPPLSERTITVLFADLAESTTLAERVGAKRFSEILNRFYHEMTDVVFDNGGLLNKYMGDGLMAVFGVIAQRQNPEERAVKAALEMLQRLDSLNMAENEMAEMSIGINTGTAMAGYVGTDERIEFTVLGDSVNTAQRLQTLARPNRIIIGPQTARAVEGQFNLKAIGAVELKGKVQSVEATEVLRPERPARGEA
ncbi:MAG TPA: adenylate/guanylate cyclase domain-containing protein [Anaerolineales bacterium]|nr:adenylate/guanylate cyclase domain-containing protein [Anaerolineales bacterium]